VSFPHVEIQARSSQRFPSLSPIASCSLHEKMGERCTPMDCEFYRVAPVRLQPVLSQNAEEQAIERAKQMLSVPTKKKGKGKR